MLNIFPVLNCASGLVTQIVVPINLMVVFPWKTSYEDIHFNVISHMQNIQQPMETPNPYSIPHQNSPCWDCRFLTSTPTTILSEWEITWCCFYSIKLSSWRGKLTRLIYLKFGAIISSIIYKVLILTMLVFINFTSMKWRLNIQIGWQSLLWSNSMLLVSEKRALHS